MCIITLSSTEACLVPHTEACIQVKYNIMFMRALGFEQTGPIQIFCDDTGTIQIAKLFSVS